MGKAMILLAMLALASCARVPAPTSNPRQVWCDANAPRRPTVAEIVAMDRKAIDALNAYNGRGAAWCGWKP